MHRSSFFLPLALVPLMADAAPPAFGQRPPEQRQAQDQAARPVEIAVRIKPDDEWTYQLGLNQLVTLQPQTDDRLADGPPETSRLIQNAMITLRVISIDEQSGAATIEAGFDRLEVVVGSDDQQSEFLWSADLPGKTPETDLDRMLTALATSTLTIKVSPGGAVRGIVGYESVNEAIEAAPDVDVSALGMLGPSAMDSTLELIWKPGAISGAKRELRDEWTQRHRMSLGPIGGVAMGRRLAIDRIEDGILHADGEVTLRLLPPADASGAGAPVFDLLHEEGQMTIAWDLARGCSASVSDRLDLSAQLTLGPANLGMRLRFERSATLKTPPPKIRDPEME